VLRARADLASCFHLATVADVSTHALNVFVVEHIGVTDAKLAAPTAEPTATTTVVAVTATVIAVA
jgi:hypothetical protein